MEDNFVSEVYSRLKDIPHSALSTNGFNWWGDEKSIKKLRTLLHNEEIAEALRKELILSRQTISSLKEKINSCVSIN